MPDPATPPKPPCGVSGIGGAQWGTAAFWLGLILLILGTIANFAQIADWFDKLGVILIPLINYLLPTGLAIAVGGLAATVVTTIAIAAVVGSVGMLIIIISFHKARCDTPPQGIRACSSGVVNAIIPAFNDVADWFFPWAAVHPRAEVVVQSIYWPLVATPGAAVHCAKCNNCPPNIAMQYLPGDCSPIIACFYHSSYVCLVGAFSVFGAVLGALAGIVTGTVAGAAIAAACGILIFLCALLAVVAALLTAIITVLAGAWAGGHLAELAVPPDTRPTQAGTDINPRDYISTMGNLIISDFADGGVCYWFCGWFPEGNSVADETVATNNGTTLHGRSSGDPPFCYPDPNSFFMGHKDRCQIG